MEKVSDAHANLAFALLQDVVEPKDEEIEKPLKILGRGCDLMIAEEFADQTGVRPPSELQAFEPVHRIEFRRKYFGKSLYSGAAGMDQRAVNIKQDQTHHA